MKNLNIILGSLILASCSSGPSSSDVDMLATGEINEIICEEECVIEGVNLKDVQLESVNLKNISFKNSYFENVTIKGSQDKFTVLEGIKFIDSEINNLSIESFVVTYDPSNFDLGYLENYIKKECERYVVSDDVKNRGYREAMKENLEECRIEIKEDARARWKLDYTDFRNWKDGFEGYQDLIQDQLNIIGRWTDNAEKLVKEGMSIHFENVTGSLDIIDAENSFIVTKVANSTFNKFKVDDSGNSLVFLYANNSNFKNLSYWHPEYSRLSRLSDDRATVQVSFVDSKIESLDALNVGGGALVCDNSEFDSDNLLMVVEYCDDMGINFDEFAYGDFYKTFIPDNSMAFLKDFIKSDYSSVYVGKRIQGFNKIANNTHNQLYAISSGDDEFLMSYLDGLYKHMFLNEKWVYETRICGNQHSLLDFNWSRSNEREDCKTERLRVSQVLQWLLLPDSFKTKIDKRTSNFLSGLLDKSSTDNEKFISEFVKKNHDFSNLKNCLRTRDIKSVRETLSKLYEVPLRSSPNWPGKRATAMRTYMQKKASEKNEIQSFKSCIEQNISISIPQMQAAYSPISKLTSFAYNELGNYKDEGKRLRAVAAQKKRVEREKLYESFVKNSQDQACGIMATSMGSQIINMYYSGSTESKIARTKRAYDACNRCNFNFWSNMLSDDDFLKLANGEEGDLTTDMSSFGIADVKKMLMCPVAGADPQVRREYELMMQ